jgi:hypothetical protein
MKYTLIERLAIHIDARRNCEDTGNNEWYKRHGEMIESLVALLPFDAELDCNSTGDKITLSFSYHHYNEHGYGCGWSDHTFTFVPSFYLGVNIAETSSNFDGVDLEAMATPPDDCDDEWIPDDDDIALTVEWLTESTENYLAETILCDLDEEVSWNKEREEYCLG